MTCEQKNCHDDEMPVRPMVCHTLAMVCPPEQYWGQLYTPDDGLEVGTLFECLNLPFDPMCRGKEWNG